MFQQSHYVQHLDITDLDPNILAHIFKRNLSRSPIDIHKVNYYPQDYFLYSDIYNSNFPT